MADWRAGLFDSDDDDGDAGAAFERYAAEFAAAPEEDVAAPPPAPPRAPPRAPPPREARRGDILRGPGDGGGLQRADELAKREAAAEAARAAAAADAAPPLSTRRARRRAPRREEAAEAARAAAVARADELEEKLAAVQERATADALATATAELEATRDRLLRAQLQLSEAREADEQRAKEEQVAAELERTRRELARANSEIRDGEARAGQIAAMLQDATELRQMYADRCGDCDEWRDKYEAARAALDRKPTAGAAELRRDLAEERRAHAETKDDLRADDARRGPLEDRAKTRDNLAAEDRLALKSARRSRRPEPGDDAAERLEASKRDTKKALARAAELAREAAKASTRVATFKQENDALRAEATQLKLALSTSVDDRAAAKRKHGILATQTDDRIDQLKQANARLSLKVDAAAAAEAAAAARADATDKLAERIRLAVQTKLARAARDFSKYQRDVETKFRALEVEVDLPAPPAFLGASSSKGKRRGSAAAGAS
ncbi:hypothetical protein JL722_3516 [Aureococcus anophagefferens]|nr:hypothetical protein JL722_3516 [Aureococcus anophagefferens]